MKVSELITKLQTMNQDWEVEIFYFSSDENDYYNNEISDFNIREDEDRKLVRLWL